MKKELSDKQIIEILRRKVKSLYSEALEYERKAAEVKERAKTFENTIMGLGGKIETVAHKESNANKTFAQVVKEILDDGVPRTSRQLYNEYLILLPNTAIRSFYDFSGRFSNVQKKLDIKKHNIPENPINIRTIYGFSSWFEGDKLKTEFLNKVNLE